MARLQKREDARNARQEKRDKRLNNETIHASNEKSTIGKVGSHAQYGLTKAYQETKMKVSFKDYPYLGDAFDNCDNLIFECEDYMEGFIDEKHKMSFNEFTSSKNFLRWKAKVDKDLGEKGTREEFTHKIVQLVADYVYNGDRTIRQLEKSERKTEERLNKMLNNITNNQELSESAVGLFQQTASYMCNLVQKYSRMIVSGRQHFIQLSHQVTNEYCDRLDRERRR